MESDQTNTPSTCPDCQGELKEIRMIDDARFGHQRMRFTLMGEKRSIPSGNIFDLIDAEQKGNI